MNRLVQLFGDKAEVIADYAKVAAQTTFAAHRADVLTLVSRRPCTLDDIASGLALHRNETIKYVQELLTDGEIKALERGDKTYYAAR